MYTDRTEELLPYLPLSVRRAMKAQPAAVRGRITEIRLRSGRPVSVTSEGKSLFFGTSGELYGYIPQRPVAVSAAEVEETVFRLCGGSVYSHEDELARGFISVRGGHRAGVCGTGVYLSGTLTGMRDITSVNIRIARSVRGCSDAIDLGAVDGGLLIAGAPGSGKTTVLKDLLRRLSDGSLGRVLRVCAVDERGELCDTGGSAAGAGFDLLCGIDKREAVNMLLRSMSPQVVALDEISTMAEVEAVRRGIACGVDFIMTVHADGASELLGNPVASELLGMCANTALLGRTPGDGITVYGSKEIENADAGRFVPRSGDNVARTA